MAVAHYHSSHFVGQTGSGPGVGPSVPSLTVVDNEDGTGAVATVADSSGGSTNEVFVADWPGSTFVSAGNRSGDGTVNLSLTVGPKFAYVKSTLNSQSEVSATINFRVTDGTTAIFYQCLLAVQSIIQGLALDGIASADVVVQKLPWDRRITKPGILIHPRTEQIFPATNESDDVGYAVMVTMISASNEDLVTDLDRLTLWREQISRGFRHKPLPGVGCVYTVKVEPGVVVLPEGFSKMYDVGALTLRCISREPATVI